MGRKLFQKGMASVLSLLMVVSAAVPQSISAANAADVPPGIAATMEDIGKGTLMQGAAMNALQGIVETNPVSDAASNLKDADVFKAATDATNVDDKKKASDPSEAALPFYDAFYKDAKVSKEEAARQDFSSKELIAAADADQILDPRHVVDSGEGMYVLRYESAEQARNAYSYYYGRTSFVSPNIAMQAADTKNGGPSPDVGTPLDTLTQLGDLKTKTNETLIAVIDSGMPEHQGVKARVSVITNGNEVADDNGHGTKTMQAIFSINPNAKLLSIKALNASGKGSAASIAAGIEYAKNSGARILVLPLYAYALGEHAALRTVIEEAIASGMTVVGAAGNDGANVKYYVPGNIEKAYIVGAANERGEKIAGSNFGDTVDYNVIAGSTSEASAKFAGLLSTMEGDLSKALEAAANAQTLIFRTNEVKQENRKDAETAEDVIAKHPVDFSKKATVRYTFVDDSLLTKDDYWDTLMEGKREKLLATIVSDVSIYQAKDGSYRLQANAPWANGVATGGVIDYTFANGNNNGEVITEGVSFNRNTRVATISEAALSLANDDFSNIQMQILVPTNLSKKANIGVTIESKGQEKVQTELQRALFDPPYVALHVEGRTLSKSDLSVYANGELLSDAGFDFDAKQSIVSLKGFSAGISKIRIVIHKEVKAGFDGAFADGASTVPDAVAFYLKNNTDVSRLQKGVSWTARSTWGKRSWNATPISKKLIEIKNVGRVKTTTGPYKKNGASEDEYIATIGFPQRMFDTNFSFYEPDGKTSMGRWEDKKGRGEGMNIGIKSYCTHEKTSFNQTDGYKETRYHILSRTTFGNETEFILAYETLNGISNTSHAGVSQNAGGVVRFRVRNDAKASVRVMKRSSNPSYTNGNANYSLEGAEFELWTPDEHKQNTQGGAHLKDKVATFKTNAKGESNVVNFDDMTKLSSYNANINGVVLWLIETKAPKGFLKDTKWKAVFIRANQMNVIEWADEPGGDPFVISLAKAPLAGGNGDYPTTVGAEFTVKYYEGFYNSKAELPAKAKYSWTYVSKAYKGGGVPKGLSLVDFAHASYLKEGSSKEGLFIRNPGEVIEIPYGTITIEETKAPPSYLLEPNYIVNGNGDTKDELLVHVNYNNTITFADKTPATNTQMQLDGANITTLAKETMLPTVTTSLRAENGTQFREATKDVKLTDSVTLNNCESLADLGKEIVVTGRLYDVETGKLVPLSDGTTEVSTKVAVKNVTESVQNTFVFDASAYQGHTLVATETVTMDGKEIVKHDQRSDEAQMVHFPKIGTTNLGKETGKHVADIDGEIVLEDTVSYENLEPNHEYTLHGILMDQKTGAPVLDESGKEVTASTTFTTGDANADDGQKLTGFDEHANPKYSEVHKLTVSGSTKVVFTFKASDEAKQAAQRYVAFEEIKGYAVHQDLNDEGQTVYFPHIDTLAYNGKENANKDYHGKDTIAMELTRDVKIYDKVVVSGISPDAGALRLDAYLYDAATGKKLYHADGTPVSGSKTFHADPSGNAAEVVEFSAMDATTLQFADGSKYDAKDKTVVVYEYLSSEGVGIGAEAELHSKNQSVIFPDVHTTATEENASYKDNHYLPSYDANADKVYLQDQVEYKNLLPNTTYHVKGILMDKATGKALLVGGKEVVSEKDFTTGEATTGRGLVNGSVTVSYELPASLMKGKTTVAFETITLDGLEVIAHTDLGDADQTDYFPGGHTILTDSKTKDHIANADTSVKLIDVITYTNMKPDTEFTMKGTLRDQKTGEVIIDADGKEVTSSARFKTPKAQRGEKSVDGKVEVSFEFNASNLKNRIVVAFESIWRNDLKEEKLMWKHEDLNDPKQTMYFPGGHTTATDSETNGHTALADEDVTIIDHVEYEGLFPNKEYSVKGKLMDQATGKPILVDGKEVTASATFTTPVSTDEAPTVSGTIDVEFHFDGSALAGTSSVVFEDIYDNGVKVFTHSDLKDKAQTVKFPSMITSVQDAKDHDRKIIAKETVTIIDSVNYTGLEKGKSYTMKGTIMEKATGSPLRIDEKEVVSITHFTPEQSDGSTQVKFEFDASKLKLGNYVVYETLTETDSNIVVGVHEDIENKEQTFLVEAIPPIPSVPKTGDQTDVFGWSVTAIGSLFLGIRMKKREEEINILI